MQPVRQFDAAFCKTTKAGRATARPARLSSAASVSVEPPRGPAALRGLATTARGAPPAPPVYRLLLQSPSSRRAARPRYADLRRRRAAPTPPSPINPLATSVRL